MNPSTASGSPPFNKGGTEKLKSGTPFDKGAEETKTPQKLYFRQYKSLNAFALRLFCLCVYIMDF